jgi:hypothetical protein
MVRPVDENELSGDPYVFTSFAHERLDRKRHGALVE